MFNPEISAFASLCLLLIQVHSFFTCLALSQPAAYQSHGSLEQPFAVLFQHDSSRQLTHAFPENRSR